MLSQRVCTFVVDLQRYMHVVDGGWYQWSAWNRCPITCGRGSQFRTRICSSTLPTFNGRTCEGTHYESKRCIKRHCGGNYERVLYKYGIQIV